MAGEDIAQLAQDGIQHYKAAHEVPLEIKKYWQQRYDIFSKYDEGIWMTDDAWFGITPEPVALMIAHHVAIAAPASKTVLIDTFGGAGGNAIAFALSGRWEQIFVIEKDPKVLKCAKHNASIYGVAKKIVWRQGDSLQMVPKTFKGLGKKAVVFASPPWGGPGYRDDKIFNLETMQPYSLTQLHNAFSKLTKEIVLFLPRTSNLNHLTKYSEAENQEKQLKVIHYCMNGASKALCAFYGDFSLNQTP